MSGQILCRHLSTKSGSVRISCGSGFWGDTPTAPAALIHGNNKLDYLMFDYLSELTMSLLTAAQAKNPDMGYAVDFVTSGIGPHLKQVEKQGLKVIANAGGINTSAAVAALKQAAQKAGADLKIAEVKGDNLIGKRKDLIGNVKEMKTGKLLPKTVHSMTAYFGAGPIVKALEMGADIVVTGRTADSALALAPFMHEFKWKNTDYDKLAAGSLAGHIIECGGQSTGGLFTDWETVQGYENLGFPIIEMSEDGSMILSKPEGSGGLIHVGAASEQMLYEIGDPRNYYLPDVNCDFTNVKMSLINDTSIKISGARGKPPTDTYKVSATVMDGYRGTGVSIVAGGKATLKAQKTSDAIMKRSSFLFNKLGMEDFKDKYVTVLGSEKGFFGKNARNMDELREAVIWMGVHHQDKKAIQIWAQEIASAGTGMTPGLTGMIGGRPKATPVLKLFSFLYPKKYLPATITLNETSAEYSPELTNCTDYQDVIPDESQTISNLPSGNHDYTLEDLAYGRSGDKGDSCNIGIIARHPNFLPYIKHALTNEAVAEYFAHVFPPNENAVKLVKRYDVPGIHAVNFLLENSLGGGGMCSLRPDPLGKSFAQNLLCFEIRGIPSLDDIMKM